MTDRPTGPDAQLSELLESLGWTEDGVYAVDHDHRIIYVLGLSVFAVAWAGTFYGVDGLLEGVDRRVPALR
jgi:hypothetical protein